MQAPDQNDHDIPAPTHILPGHPLLPGARIFVLDVGTEVAASSSSC
jgi:hypothetical protein